MRCNIQEEMWRLLKWTELIEQSFEEPTKTKQNTCKIRAKYVQNTCKIRAKYAYKCYAFILNSSQCNNM